MYIYIYVCVYITYYNEIHEVHKATASRSEKPRKNPDDEPPPPQLTVVRRYGGYTQ